MEGEGNTKEEVVVVAVISKKQMSEEDIKLQYITPAITNKWDIKKIQMEAKITDGRINLKGNFVTRERPKRADYVLYLLLNYIYLFNYLFISS